MRIGNIIYIERVRGGWSGGWGGLGIGNCARMHTHARTLTHAHF
jgi:hypothetical protein